MKSRHVHYYWKFGKFIFSRKAANRRESPLTSLTAFSIYPRNALEARFSFQGTACLRVQFPYYSSLINCLCVILNIPLGTSDLPNWISVCG